MLSGGGTGGHIFPAIAIADALKRRFPDAEFLFVGAKDRMEMQRVPKAGYAIEGLWISGIQRKLSASNLAFPFKLFSSLAKSRRLISRFKPDVVIGTGGFASGPLLFAASRKHIPCLIQEQNSYPGITNKILASRVQKICVAYDGMERFFPKEKVLKTGNPIRQNLHNHSLSPEAANKELGLSPDRKTLLVLGGSLGARKINELISEHFEEILSLGINLYWQCGKLYEEALLEKFGSKQNNQFKISAFIQDMSIAYCAADFVISRAGAGTLSELATMEKASLLIPSPNVAEDHQTKNALALVEAEAALLHRESEHTFIEKLQALLDTATASKLRKNIATLALPNAAETIADEVESLIAQHAR
jgi:UDP-N-acetylglucosamine--N-acetylmuramyl-(pentapeptide) pyrophosphoryl-undecaprenol N-acetylglucosamine transferase